MQPRHRAPAPAMRSTTAPPQTILEASVRYLHTNRRRARTAQFARWYTQPPRVSARREALRQRTAPPLPLPSARILGDVCDAPPLSRPLDVVTAASDECAALAYNSAVAHAFLGVGARRAAAPAAAVAAEYVRLPALYGCDPRAPTQTRVRVAYAHAAVERAIRVPRTLREAYSDAGLFVALHMASAETSAPLWFDDSDGAGARVHREVACALATLEGGWLASVCGPYVSYLEYDDLTHAPLPTLAPVLVAVGTAAAAAPDADAGDSTYNLAVLDAVRAGRHTYVASSERDQYVYVSALYGCASLRDGSGFAETTCVAEFTRGDEVCAHRIRVPRTMRDVHDDAVLVLAMRYAAYLVPAPAPLFVRARSAAGALLHVSVVGQFAALSRAWRPGVRLPSSRVVLASDPTTQVQCFTARLDLQRADLGAGPETTASATTAPPSCSDASALNVDADDGASSDYDGDASGGGDDDDASVPVSTYDAILRDAILSPLDDDAVNAFLV